MSKYRWLWEQDKEHDLPRDATRGRSIYFPCGEQVHRYGSVERPATEAQPATSLRHGSLWVCLKRPHEPKRYKIYTYLNKNLKNEFVFQCVGQKKLLNIKCFFFFIKTVLHAMKFVQCGVSAAGCSGPNAPMSESQRTAVLCSHCHPQEITSWLAMDAAIRSDRTQGWRGGMQSNVLQPTCKNMFPPTTTKIMYNLQCIWIDVLLSSLKALKQAELIQAHKHAASSLVSEQPTRCGLQVNLLKNGLFGFLLLPRLVHNIFLH